MELQIATEFPSMLLCTKIAIRLGAIEILFLTALKLLKNYSTSNGNEPYCFYLFGTADVSHVVEKKIFRLV